MSDTCIYIYYCVISITFKVAVLASKIIMLSLPYHKIAFIFNFICLMQFLCRKIILCFLLYSFTRIILKLKYECFRIKLLMTVLSFTCYIMIIKSFMHWFLVEITNSESRLFSVENRSLSAGTVVWLRWIINKKQIILTCKWRTDYITLLL